MPHTRPNILFITCHDLGDYLGCYGTPVPTPCLDDLAASGVQLCNHYSPATICSPARGAILTGCYPHTNGLMGLVHRGWNLDVDHFPTMPAVLHDNGYETCLFGFQHEHMDDKRLGYETIFRGADTHAEHVVPFFEHWLSERDENRPFFAAMGFSETHRMGLNPSHFCYDGYPAFDPAAVAVRPSLPDVPGIRQDLAGFYGAIVYMDKWIGRALAALEQSRLRENTLVLFTTDHGAPFLHAKATLYDGGTRVALMASWPGVLPKGKKVRQLTSHVDILPTILTALGIRIPETVQGHDQTHALLESFPVREYAFSEENYNNHFAPARAVRSEQFRYIKNGLRTCLYDFQIPEIELSSFGFRHHKEVFGFYSARRVFEELYDLCADPGELHNVAEDPHYSEILAEHRQALREHMERTRDPFADFHNELLMPQEDYAVLQRIKAQS